MSYVFLVFLSLIVIFVLIKRISLIEIKFFSQLIKIIVFMILLLTIILSLLTGRLFLYLIILSLIISFYFFIKNKNIIFNLSLQEACQILDLDPNFFSVKEVNEAYIRLISRNYLDGLKSYDFHCRLKEARKIIINELENKL